MKWQNQRLQAVKSALEGSEGTSRRQSEWQGAHRTDAAFKQLLEVQAALKEEERKLQGLYDLKQKTEYVNAKRYGVGSLLWHVGICC